MTGIYAFALILAVYAIGDFIAVKTKAIISMVLTGSIIFLIAFWLGFPAEVFQASGLIVFYSVTNSMLMVNTGSTIRVKELIAEWKTVVLVLCSTIAICLGIYFIGGVFIDRYQALAGAPIVAGGLTALMVMQEAFTKIGSTDVLVFSALVMGLQSLFGFPIASILCKMEAKRYKKEINNGTALIEQPLAAEEKTERKKLFPAIPEKYNSPYLIITKVAIVASFATFLSKATGGKISGLIFAIILGVICAELGLIEERPMEKANAYTLLLVAAFVPIFNGLSTATPELVFSMFKPLLIVIVIGLVCCFVVSVAVGKIFKQSWYMAFALGVTALLGFPGTFFVSQEVSNAVGETKEEKDLIMAHIMPKMVIGGITSVSVVSGLVASVMVNWI